MSRGPQPIEPRFWAKVDKTDGDGCWLWTGSRRHRYGEFWVNGKREYPHRVSFELANGPIPAGLVVCHKCDVPLCVRPDHLFIGTLADNFADMRAKGRGAAPPRRPPSNAAHGSTAKYVSGCRCESCFKAMQTYNREYRQRLKVAKENDGGVA